jgi:hypothetical protein
VRVAALYDIHGNVVALRAVLADLEREQVALLRSLQDRAVYVPQAP